LPEQWSVVRAISRCREALMGWRKLKCKKCGEKIYLYRSCRNRHCPLCQGVARAKWVRDRLKELLPVPYFHVVFTLAGELRALALRNKKVIYDILFRASSETLMEVSERNLNARIGALGILHTWGQQMMDHPHIHFIVTGGGLSLDGLRWIFGKQKYFLPKDILSEVFQGKLLDYIGQAYRAGELIFPGEIEHLADPAKFASLLRSVVRKRLVVHIKRPFGGPEQVLCYLGRYTHRVAITNKRILKMENEMVTFEYKDYADKNKVKTMELPVEAFLRRFLMHVLPERFKKIRMYGIWGNRAKMKLLPQCRDLIAKQKPAKMAEMLIAPGLEVREPETTICPKCGGKDFEVIEDVTPRRFRRRQRRHQKGVDVNTT